MSIRESLSGEALSHMRRYPQRGWIAGVCAGVAEYFGWNLKLLRLLVVLAMLCTRVFPIAVIYLVLWYLLNPVDSTDPSTGEETVTAARDPSKPVVRPRELKTRFSRLEQRLSNMEECVVSKDFELRQELRKLEG
jgi:phage shock protein C